MRLKDLRLEKDWTLEYVASQMNVSIQTISNWENHHTEPDIKSLIKLANLFRVTIDYLVERQSQKDSIEDLKIKIQRMNAEDLRNLTMEYLSHLNDKE